MSAQTNKNPCFDLRCWGLFWE